jgi:hypothetical protein
MRARPRIVAFAVMIGAAGCGDCLEIGMPALDVMARDAVTGAQVGLAGATIRHRAASFYPGDTLTDTMRPDFPPSQAWGACCLKGPVWVRLEVPGYQPADTTVSISTQGRCRTPVRKMVVMRLRRAT